MKKDLIAAAVAAAVAVPAVAQVTISGTLDLSALQDAKVSVGGTPAAALAGATNGEFSSTTSAVANVGSWTTSNLSFSATEDLGGGLKASAFINQGVNNNTGALDARDRFVALGGGFGEVKLGRFTPALDGYGGYAAPGTPNSFGTSDSDGFDLLAGTIATTQTVASMRPGETRLSDRSGSFARQAGVVQYSSPVLSGFKVTAELIQNESNINPTDSTGKTKGNQNGFRLDYTAGPLAISYANGKRKVENEQVAAVTATALEAGATGGVAAVNNRSGSASVQWLGAAYSLGGARLFYAYGDRDDKETSNTAANGEVKTKETTIHNLGVSVALGAMTLTASAYEGDVKMPNTAAAVALDGANDRDVAGYQVGARYALSKRTYGYAVMGQNKSEDKTPAAAAADITKVRGYAVGLVHTF